MKKYIFFLLPAILACASTQAQLNSILNKTKSKAQQRVDRRTDQAIDAALDKAEAKTKPAPGQAKQEPGEPVTAAKNEPNSSKPESAENNLASYSRFDFIPGEKILYTEDFSQDEIGELPLQWNTGGKAEVVTLNNMGGNWLRMFQNSLYLTSNKVPFTKNFTVEFDIVLQLKNNGYTFPYISFGFLSSEEFAPNDNRFLNNYHQFQSTEFMLRLASGGASHVYMATWEDQKKFFGSDIQNIAALESYYGKSSHIAIQVQESRTRIWINGEKKFDLPMAGPTAHIFNNLFFKIHSSSYKDDQIGFYVSNLKVATGKPDSRHKLLEEGKFSTTGILFDFQSATLKPESAGVLKDMAKILNENPSLRIHITGHTSSDGDDKANMELSKKRAEAVRNALVTEFGIAGERITSDGKGETQPVADNQTKEGKIQNRRVEFTKL